ncbi:hypothetical protein [Alicyclobacillus ferrooxydans]|uniref:hypothetical protein n=1 Tax=Alicyclobacillus ferrooxydans TaxID=471514 RepID=UPI000AE3B5B5|nr:hypothetical protein [Alicyclobacillus ferrooxydans]
MSELYIVWHRTEGGWWPSSPVTSDMARAMVRQIAHKTIVVPAPVMTAKAWVESGEVG